MGMDGSIVGGVVGGMGESMELFDMHLRACPALNIRDNMGIFS